MVRFSITNEYSTVSYYLCKMEGDARMGSTFPGRGAVPS